MNNSNCVRRLARWKIADILSLVACKLRGHEWYLADVWHGVPGNRAAELREKVWQNAVLLTPAREYKSDLMAELESDLNELAQLAGENWGHIKAKWPNEKS